jgi:hypothetical protein
VIAEPPLEEGNSHESEKEVPVVLLEEIVPGDAGGLEAVFKDPVKYSEIPAAFIAATRTR